MRRVVVSGRTVDDAVTSALVQLGVPRAQAHIRVITEPVKGLFGLIGSKDAEVEVSVQATPQETAKEFLQQALNRMGVISDVSVERDTDTNGDFVLVIRVGEEALPYIIGRHGSTLEALSYLTNVAANREHEGFVKFSVDAGNYRQRRRESLGRAAMQAAQRAVEFGRPVSLDPMSAADRKWVHTYLQERDDVTTSSEGRDPHRRVKVIPRRKSYRNT